MAVKFGPGTAVGVRIGSQVDPGTAVWGNRRSSWPWNGASGTFQVQGLPAAPRPLAGILYRYISISKFWYEA